MAVSERGRTLKESATRRDDLPGFREIIAVRPVPAFEAYNAPETADSTIIR